MRLRDPSVRFDSRRRQKPYGWFPAVSASSVERDPDLERDDVLTLATKDREGLRIEGHRAREAAELSVEEA
jgi:hypothetical protein